MTMSIVNTAMAIKEGETKGNVGTAVLSKALDLHEEIANDLIQSLGIGLNVDVEV